MLARWTSRRPHFRRLQSKYRSLSYFSYPESFPETTETACIERCISADDVAAFANLTHDHNPVHFEGERPVVHGALLNGLVSSVIGCHLPGPGTRVVEQRFTFPSSCHVGDTVRVRVDLPEKRKLTKCYYRVTRLSDGTDVMLGEAKLVLMKG